MLTAQWNIFMLLVDHITDQTSSNVIYNNLQERLDLLLNSVKFTLDEKEPTEILLLIATIHLQLI